MERSEPTLELTSAELKWARRLISELDKFAQSISRSENVSRADLDLAHNLTQSLDQIWKSVKSQ